MKNPPDPHDPRLNRSGNRLFRNAAQQRQRKPSFSWAKVAIAVTVLFTSAGAAFYYMGTSESHAPANKIMKLADSLPASQTSATQSAAAIPLITPAPATPTPKPTPEPTPKATRKRTVAKASSEGTSKAKAKAKAKNKIDPPAKEVLTTGRRELVESGSARRGDAPRATTKAAAGTAKTASRTKSAAAKPAATATDNTPPEAQRPRFNMRPESERSASTERVNNLQEFPSAPGMVDTPAAAKKAPAKKKADGDSATALPPVPTVSGREQSSAAPAGKAVMGAPGGLSGSVSQSTTREEASVATAPPVPKVDLEDRSVEYQGPPEENNAPVVVKGATRPFPVPRQAMPYRQERMVNQPMEKMAGQLSQIDGVEVKVVPE